MAVFPKALSTTAQPMAACGTRAETVPSATALMVKGQATPAGPRVFGPVGLGQAMELGVRWFKAATIEMVQAMELGVRWLKAATALEAAGAASSEAVGALETAALWWRGRQRPRPWGRWRRQHFGDRGGEARGRGGARDGSAVGDGGGRARGRVASTPRR